MARTALRFLVPGLFALLALGVDPALACRDAVVLVHGNTGSPSDWNNTVDRLLQQG